MYGEHQWDLFNDLVEEKHALRIDTGWVSDIKMLANSALQDPDSSPRCYFLLDLEEAASIFLGDPETRGS